MLIHKTAKLGPCWSRAASSAAATATAANKRSPADLRAVDAFRPAFPVAKLTKLLDHDNHEMRAELRHFLSKDQFRPKYDIRLPQERELALTRLKAICDKKFISVLDFWQVCTYFLLAVPPWPILEPLRIFAAHELSAIVDPAMTTKMTVQFK